MAKVKRGRRSALFWNFNAKSDGANTVCIMSPLHKVSGTRGGAV